MPTKVSVARQCLTDEAATVLDDAVAVARRRSHAQTTSLHTVSALLASPSSSFLRDACARARSSASSSRLQFRLLDLSVGVSLDRVSSSKPIDDPPISNSLMAAIKRSQANQRRDPDNFHLQQFHFNPETSPSVLKVELKHLVLSILDDPTVNRIFGEAGFRSSDVKLAIIHPPLPAKFSRTLRPPIFLCNLTDSDPGPLGLFSPLNGDENCRRIGEVLLKRSSKRKNPLLIGACAGDALRGFIECVNRDKAGVLPAEISGLRAICIEKEVADFLGGRGSGHREKIGIKFEELGHELEQCSGPGILANFGDLKVLMGENVGDDAGLSYLASKLTGLLEGFTEKLWLIGAAESCEMYMKFVEKFPSVEKDWDLHLLRITSGVSVERFGAKSSLMGSFVPFGGCLSMPPDFKNPLSTTNQTITRCHLCTSKYEQEVADILKMGSPISVSDQYSEKLPSWLQMDELETSKEMDSTKTKDDGFTLNAKILGLQKKWNDICRRLHHAQPFSKIEIPQSVPRICIAGGYRYAVDAKESGSTGNNRESSLNESQHAIPSLGICVDLQNKFLSKDSKHSLPIPYISNEPENVHCWSKVVEEVSKNQQKGKGALWSTPYPLPSLSQPADHVSSSSLTSLTTDLGLGTLYASNIQELNTNKLHDQEEHRQQFKGFNSTEFDAVSQNMSLLVGQSSSCSGPSGGQFDLRDYKSLRKVLAENIGWQDEAICTISEVVSRCRAGYRKRLGSDARRDIWLTFLGPDKVGKKRIAATLAETIFGSHENLFSMDFSSHDRLFQSTSIFGSQELNYYDVKYRGKTVADYIAAELRKKPHSVIFLENIDKADPLAQNSLSVAIRTGRFPDSHGREISINSTIFVTTSTTSLCNNKVQSHKESSRLSEERILEAKRWKMKIVIERVARSSSTSKEMNVKVSEKSMSTTSALNKRKLGCIPGSIEKNINLEAKKQANKPWRSFLDLNLPVEETEENDIDGECDGDSISENSEAWLEEFFDQVDGKVEFKPFDFDALAEKIMKEINMQFLRVFGSDALLEIDSEVMEQVIAACWMSDRKRAMEEWVETVLGAGFREARLKYKEGVKSAVKLLTCNGVLAEEQVHGIYLPSTINL